MNTILLLFFISCKSDFIHPQFGFAHRVNTASNIKAVLEAGVNGIEIDICWGKRTPSDDKYDWFVSHSDLDVCHNTEASTLSTWLLQLKCILYNIDKDNSSSTINPNQLAMLWLDIKDPQVSAMSELPDLVHQIGLPPKLEIMYDLTGYNDNSKKGFDLIYQQLRDNEGITFCAGKSCKGTQNTMRDIYNYCKDRNFTRCIFNTGDSLNIDENFLIYANSRIFNEPSDPYRFKSVFSWTNNNEDEIDKFVTPANEYQTDGQIFGDWKNEWSEKRNDGKYVGYFEDSVNNYLSERVATLNDDVYNQFMRHQSEFLVDSNDNIMILSNVTYIGLKSKLNNKFLTIYPDERILCDYDDILPTDYQKLILYQIQGFGEQIHFIVSKHLNQFLVGNNDYSVSIDAIWPNDWERWFIIDNGGYVAIKSYHNRYLNVYEDGSVDIREDGMESDGTQFQIVYYDINDGIHDGIETMDLSETAINDIPTPFPTFRPSYCPTQLPTISPKGKEAKAWFTVGVVFIVIFGVSVLIILYLIWKLYRKKKDDKLKNKYRKSRSHSHEFDQGGPSTLDIYGRNPDEGL